MIVIIFKCFNFIVKNLNFMEIVFFSQEEDYLRFIIVIIIKVFLQYFIHIKAVFSINFPLINYEFSSN